ncbi:Prolyl endopeptidase precursor [Rubripirellula reticaptiva]|uniref:prolyl oligopeptidase n=2 Tax=Rubripirellula reticaptiva TaxID=2528013 RepID=A0A5C6FBE5_9BACT|nr:Prolyl endopeptidase precursor [Rubripirellula reticaptiva]
MKRLGLAAIGCACSLVPSFSFAQTGSATAMKYPDTVTVDVTDDYFGRKVNDPYRWLEDTESEATAAWIEAENKVTQNYLQSLPQREPIRARLEELWNYERYNLPAKKGDFYLYSHNDGLQDQSILYKASGLDTDREILIDPMTFSKDGTVALAGTATSDDGKLIAYGLADGGSDWRTWKVRDVTSGKDLTDVVEWVKFSSIAWKPDSSGFFYCRYDAPVEGAELTGTNENQRMYFHKLGDKQSQDTLVLERPDQPKWGFSPVVTDDGHYLVIQNWRGTEPQSQVFIKDLRDDDASVVPMITGFDADFVWVASVDDTHYFVTDHESPKRRLIAVPAGAENRDAWKEVIAETTDVLESASLFGTTFYVSYLKDARGRVTRHHIDGTVINELSLPGVGTVGGFSGKQDANETFFSFTNYVTPTSIYRVDLQTGKVSLWRQPEVAFNVDDFVTEQLFCKSKDGTKIPIIVTRKKDTILDGSNPTMLYGYGGFNISITPGFSPATVGWIDAGGVYAVVNLRGGGEYGREWHEAGMKLKKQNVFDDCIAAAELLIAKKYTTATRLSLSGRSNGGLLVGAVVTQRPDLFGACLPQVGVMDMLRYHKFTIGWAWASEFGSSDEEDQVDNLLSYSPLHNIKPGVCYPATLVTTADRDDRVVPGHSFKFAAALQAAQSVAPNCDRPTLIRIETRAGHGAGTPVSKQIEEYADKWAFLLENLK